ncbi:aspartate/glutamate racemase family protein [Brevibacillus massiliensis]|uniref:aspartate/glutamate racemase family protein n=1 Tax=Brevibacillus massiliensis TaxID=1118054 RepID=UPI000312D9E9|nr:aspartate/glutamate racemase family protein [Brevibacillus massiliensis]
MIGIIRVLTTSNPEILGEHGAIIEGKYGVATRSACIPDQPHGVYDEETERIAVPKIVALGKELAASGCRVLVVSCADDPGGKELRRHVSVPVIGAGSAAAFVACGFGEPVGLLDITSTPPRVMQEALGEQLAWHACPEGVTNTTDLLTPSGQKEALRAARSLVEKGAKTLAFACTGYSTIGKAQLIRKELGTTVIDPVEAEGLLAFYALNRS